MSVWAQTTFEKGYFIDSLNNKTECLIKNVDWNKNPRILEYKSLDEKTSDKISALSIKEFGIDGIAKYIRQSVQIDRSGESVSGVSDKRAPEWSSEELLLRVLIEGKATLYSYQQGNWLRFFYQVGDSPIEQLVFKKFLMAGAVATNNDFKQQLWNSMRCPSATEATVKELAYEMHDLVVYFRDYNACSGNNYSDFYKRRKEHLIKSAILTGVNFASYEGAIFSPSYSRILKHNVHFRIGCEMAYILPFNNNRWALVAEPTAIYFKSKNLDVFASPNDRVNFYGIELPMGLRHYFFLNKEFQIFLNGFYVAHVNLPNSVNKHTEYAAMPHLIWAVGGGLVFKKFSAQFRYYVKMYNERQNTVILGYRLN